MEEHSPGPKKYTGCFTKIYPVEMLNFERPRALMSLCNTSHKFQNMKVLLDTLHDDFGSGQQSHSLFVGSLIFSTSKFHEICAIKHS